MIAYCIHSLFSAYINFLEIVASTDSDSIRQAQQIYSQRVFSDEFHQFTEICMEKKPSSRWSTLQLLSHSFFKQCRHTSILDQLQRFGLETKDYSQIRGIYDLRNAL